MLITRQSSSDDWMLVRNPATGEALTTVPKSTSGEILQVVENSVKAFKLWSNTPRGERQDKLYILASLIRLHEAEIVSGEDIWEELADSVEGSCHHGRNGQDEFRCSIRNPAGYRYDPNCSGFGIPSWRASGNEGSYADLHLSLPLGCLRCYYSVQSPLPGTTVVRSPLRNTPNIH
jgi:hypothetical protein